MRDVDVGRFVTSKAGHDYGRLYVIIRTDGEYLYLVDGNIRKLDNPKKKNIKHVNVLAVHDDTLSDKIKSMTINNEDIKRTIKMLQDKTY